MHDPNIIYIGSKYLLPLCDLPVNFGKLVLWKADTELELKLKKISLRSNTCEGRGMGGKVGQGLPSDKNSNLKESLPAHGEHRDKNIPLYEASIGQKRRAPCTTAAFS